MIHSILQIFNPEQYHWCDSQECDSLMAVFIKLHSGMMELTLIYIFVYIIKNQETHYSHRRAINLQFVLKSQDSFGELDTFSWFSERVVYYQTTQLNLPAIVLNAIYINAIMPSGKLSLCRCGAITLELITISFKKYVFKRVIQNWVENIPFSWVLNLLSCVCILSSLNAPWAYHLWIRRNINYTYYYYYYVHYLRQSVRGDSKHFDISIISLKLKHFGANG